jgi:5-methyltetrahydropteroyltriglutamate--homocysteine methyltransferase
VRWQEEIGIDVLVHGEFERNDMVQYFGEQLSGYAFTKHAWVQSYGSRYVRPPIIFGDVSRPKADDGRVVSYAQSLTKKPMKGMLTGPVTMLQWSFVRDDIPRSETCRQIALALRDEVVDLEAAGIRVIQIDEPALREGLPLRKAEWKDLSRLGGGVLPSLRVGCADRDADPHPHVLLGVQRHHRLDRRDGCRRHLDRDRAVEDGAAGGLHELPLSQRDRTGRVRHPRAARAPVDEMADLLAKAKERSVPDQIWVNPDCGLKTRKWEEVKLSRPSSTWSKRREDCARRSRMICVRSKSLGV